MGLRILIIEDESALAKTLAQALSYNQSYCVIAGSAEEARALLHNDLNFDLIILDWMLPGISGKNFLIELRNNSSAKFAQVFNKIPVIMLTARSEIEDRIEGLASGADDYLPKPFSPKELVARINAIMRRVQINENKHQELLTIDFIFGVLIIDGFSFQARFEPKVTDKSFVGRTIVQINLTALEFRLLQFFAKNIGRTFTREQILDEVWQEQSVDIRTVDVTIKRIREVFRNELADFQPEIKKLEIIATVRGVGYGILI